MRKPPARTPPAPPLGPNLYGPVPSRRLGLSLGIDLLPFKTCSMDCVYCQLGASPATTARRRAFVPVEDVLDQVRRALESGTPIDALTFSGSGEPTLHSGIGRIIRGLKRLTKAPVVVLTNGASLANPRVRADLAAADIVSPSLDAATPGVFARLNRPHPSLDLGRIIDGLAAFRRSFRGRIWLEIMLVKGVNDGPAHLRALKKAIARIRPDRVQLNTVVRPPAEPGARPLGRQELERIRGVLGGETEIIASFAGRPARRAPEVSGEAVLAALRRRPLTAADVAACLGAPPSQVGGALVRLVRQGRARVARHGRKPFYQAVPGPPGAR